MKKRTQAGFTMIELLIVIVIMGILSVVGLGTFTSSQLKARDSKRKSDLRTVGDALEVYYNDFGSYPLDNGSGAIMGCGVDAVQICTYGEIWQNSTNSTTYMVQLPEDPSGGTYYYMSDGSYYRIYAHLENENDRDVPTDINDEPTFYTLPGIGACSIGDCNYGRSSTNVNLGATN